MNRYLAGASAAATVVAAALAAWALFGPPSPPPAPAPVDSAARPAAARMADHAKAVQQAAPGLQYKATEEHQGRQRQGYAVTFEADQQRKADAERFARGRSDRENAERQAAWQKTFCTEELKRRMEADGVDVVSGRVVGEDGRTQHVADCVRGAAPPQTGPGGPLL